MSVLSPFLQAKDTIYVSADVNEAAVAELLVEAYPRHVFNLWITQNPSLSPVHVHSTHMDR